jgi:RNA polymerase sigma-70 factor, ECF subfamily
MKMCNQSIVTSSFASQATIAQRFLNDPNEASFAELFKVFTPRLIAFFRARGCERIAEDLAQEVMLTVYRKAAQIRNRAVFHAWMFRIARNIICRYYANRAREVETVDLAYVPERFVTATTHPTALPASECLDWLAFLDTPQREALTLRFIEEWDYNEIAAAQDISVGTVRWRVFSAKRKLAPYLKSKTGSGNGLPTEMKRKYSPAVRGKAKGLPLATAV